MSSVARTAKRRILHAASAKAKSKAPKTTPVVGSSQTSVVPALKKAAHEAKVISPQPGPQHAFLSCDADVVFYGGAAGGGKTMGLLLEPLHYVTRVKGFKAVIFRRTYPEITNPGGLWDESSELYHHVGGVPNRSGLRWRWPKTNSWLKFAHMQHDKDVHSWQGSQIALICFDELTHFSLRQFLYMLSRNRSACGVKPYIRATMNPDPDSWVREFIAWYLDEDGNVIPERSGVVRYFARNKDNIEWADKPETLRLLGLRPKSFTFIAANVTDNKILLNKDPEYISNLDALLPYERARLRDGNWNARPTAGSFFRKPWFEIFGAAPNAFDDEVVYWDRAATVKSPENPDPDATVGVHMGRKGNTFYVLDVVRVCDTPGGVLRTIKQTAAANPRVTTCLEEDPGQAGKSDTYHIISNLQGFRVETRRASTSKESRAKPCSTQCQAGNIKVAKAPWNTLFFSELEGFPEGAHDDQVDALSGAYNYLANNLSSMTQRKF